MSLQCNDKILTSQKWHAQNEGSGLHHLHHRHPLHPLLPLLHLLPFHFPEYSCMNIKKHHHNYSAHTVIFHIPTRRLKIRVTHPLRLKIRVTHPLRLKIRVTHLLRLKIRVTHPLRHKIRVTHPMRLKIRVTHPLRLKIRVTHSLRLKIRVTHPLRHKISHTPTSIHSPQPIPHTNTMQGSTSLHWGHRNKTVWSPANLPQTDNIPFQPSRHSVHMNVDTDKHVIDFTCNKHFGMHSLCQKGKCNNGQQERTPQCQHLSKGPLSMA